MQRASFFSILILLLFLVFPVRVHAAGGVSLSLEPSNVPVGQTARLYVDVDPGGASLNIIQARVQYDPKAWNAASCSTHESFQGIAGQSACVIDNTGGVVRLQMEARSTRGPKQETRVATVVVSRKGTGNETIGMPPGEIVIQHDGGQSSLLPMPDTVGVAGLVGDGQMWANPTPDIKSLNSFNEPITPPLENPAPPIQSEQETPKGFFQSIAAWFSKLFRIGAR